ncbi:MAG: hypothetical protein IPL72_16820 [Sulfuritalea sp.]|nr:hypothetical protein [Sulfuritalea sp.]
MTREWMPLMGTGLAVRFEILDENQAFQNHGQSLDLLAKRGGLAPDEALAIAKRRKYEREPVIQALQALALMGSNVQGDRRCAASSRSVQRP